MMMITALGLGALLITCITLVLLAVVGAVAALWLASPRSRYALDSRLYGDEGCQRDRALAQMDAERQRFYAEIDAVHRIPVIELR